MHEMLTGGELDVLTGDYLAELTMLILGRDRLKDANLGYAKTFLRQLETNLGTALEKGVKIVANAGGLNPAGLAAAVRVLADRLGLDVNVAHVEGDDLRDAGRRARARRAARRQRLPRRVGHRRVPARRRRRRRHRPGHRRVARRRAGRGALRLGARRDTTSSPARSSPGTSSSAARRPPAATTRSSTRSPTRGKPFGFPIAEVHADGSSRHHEAPRHRRAGQRRHRHRATALRDQRRALRRPGRHHPLRHDPARGRRPGPGADQRRPRRAAAAHAQGRAEHARRLPQRGHLRAHRARHRGQGRRSCSRSCAHIDATWTLARTDHPDADVQEEAAALLHCVVRGPDPKALGRAFSGAAIELALASYPGFHVTAPPGDASPYGVFTAAYVPAADVPHVAVLADGARVDIAPAATDPGRSTAPDARRCPRRCRTDRPAGCAARHGDRVRAAATRAASANVGVWVRSDDAFAWLAALPRPSRRSSDYCRRRRRCASTRHVLPNLRALNFVVEGIARRGRRFERPARPAGEGPRRVAALARRRHPGGAPVTDLFATPERLALRETVRKFVRAEVLPYLEVWETEGELPRSLHEAAARAGLIGLAYPESVGGGGGDPIDSLVLAEEFHYAGGVERRVRVAVHVRHLAAAPRRGRRPGADREVGPSDDRGAPDRLARDHRAGRRFGRRRHPHQRQARRRRLRDQRREDLHHLRRPRRLRGHRGAHRRRRARTGCR